MTIDSFDIAEDGVHIVLHIVLQVEGRQIALNYPHGEQTQALVGVPVEIAGRDYREAGLVCGLSVCIAAVFGLVTWQSREWWLELGIGVLCVLWSVYSWTVERRVEDIGETVEEE